MRVHTDGQAAASADAVGALAYTVGRSVVFGAGQYRPGTAAGDALIAHEFAHVVQQGGRAAETGQPLRVGPVDDAFERQAHAASVHGPAAAAQSRADPGVQRATDKPAPTPAGADDDCSGWFRDHESMSKRVAEHYVRTELGGQHGAVKTITCDMFAPNGAFACTVWFADGTPIRVIARPDSVVVGKFPIQTMTPPADQPLCWYSFKCPAPNHDLVLTKIKCQAAKPPVQGPPSAAPSGDLVG